MCKSVINKKCSGNKALNKAEKILRIIERTRGKTPIICQKKSDENYKVGNGRP